jgi:hypothetical protein
VVATDGVNDKIPLLDGDDGLFESQWRHCGISLAHCSIDVGLELDRILRIFRIPNG